MENTTVYFNLSGYYANKGLGCAYWVRKGLIEGSEFVFVTEVSKYLSPPIDMYPYIKNMSVAQFVTGHLSNPNIISLGDDSSEYSRILEEVVHFNRV
jgi:hypothetical protein